MALNSSAKNQHRHHLEAGSRQEDSISLNQSADPPSAPPTPPRLIFQSNAAVGELRGISIFPPPSSIRGKCGFLWISYISVSAQHSEQILSLLSFSHSPPKVCLAPPCLFVFTSPPPPPLACKLHRSARCGNLIGAGPRLVSADKDRKSLFSLALSRILKGDRTKRKRFVLAR